MNRLLRISFNTLLLSFIPILSWFLLGIIIDKSLINVFTLTYPLQFIYSIIKSVFSTGANITKEKDKNKNAVMTGLLIGSGVALILFLIIILNIDNYINFMNMDISIYRIFAIYSVIEIFLSLEFSMLLNKLYYEEKTKLANKYSLIFNLLKLIFLIGTSLITKNQIIIVITTLLPLFIYTLYVIIKNSDTFKFRLNIFRCIKYDSVELVNSVAFFLIFLFGLSNATEFGYEYTTALNFVALITDTQWDTAEAIATNATIDISKNGFNYKEHIKNGYKLLGGLFLSSLLMFVLLYDFYDLNFKLTMIYFSFEIVNFLIFPIYRINTCYLQLEWSSIKMSANKIVTSILRMILSLLKTPFCTGIGQVFSSTYQLITSSIYFKTSFKLDKKGSVIKKENCK